MWENRVKRDVITGKKTPKFKKKEKKKHPKKENKEKRIGQILTFCPE